MKSSEYFLSRKVNKLLDDFQDMRNQIALSWREEFTGFRIACSSGCAYCCRLLVRIHFLEGLLIARSLMENKDHVALAAAAKHARVVEDFRCRFILSEGEHLTEADFNTLWIERWAEQQIACPFLKQDLCSIYPIRPLTCRVHLAVDSRIPCMEPNNMVRVLDATQPHKDVLALAVQLNTAMGWEPLIVPAPLSVSVVWGQRYLLGKDLPEIKRHAS
jgi:Fe-S-cluster containining protein